jgi:heterodisulfide reductase subunit D
MESKQKIEVPVMADLFAKGEKPDFLYWVGCAGAFDARYMKVAKAFAIILNHIKANYAVLGTEETCNGDPARRAGNEMLFQMQALMLIETFKMYEVKKIVCICPHCYNILKNEYPDLGGEYEVVHYTEYLENALKTGLLKVNKSKLTGKTVTFHDPCYLGRANDIYSAPRYLLNELGMQHTEMERNKSFALCCGAGGSQMFKDAEKGVKEIFIERTEEALETKAEIIASSCPFCMTMMTDGLKYKNKEEEIKNLDLAELIADALV